MQSSLVPNMAGTRHTLECLRGCRCINSTLSVGLTAWLLVAMSAVVRGVRVVAPLNQR